MNAALTSLLRCPNCHEAVVTQDSSLRCVNGHSYDIARQGYVNLMGGGKRVHDGDTLAMVDARANFLGSGIYEPIANAVSDELRTLNAKTILDLGAGTGYYTAKYLEALPDAVAIAADNSTFAVRRAARASERMGAVQMDAWTEYPFADDTFDACTIIFAPRNVAELARVIRPGGAIVMVSPTADHLRELIGNFGMLSVDAAKDERQLAQMSPAFTRVDRTLISYTAELAPETARTLIGMGPSAHHVDVAGLELGTHTVTVAVNVDRFIAA